MCTDEEKAVLMREPVLSTAEQDKFQTTDREQLSIIHAPSRVSQQTQNQRCRFRNKTQKAGQLQRADRSTNSDLSNSLSSLSELSTDHSENEDSKGPTESREDNPLRILILSLPTTKW